MTINGTGMFNGYEVVNKTLNMSQDKVEETKNLTKDVVGGAIEKQMNYQEKMLNVNAQMQTGMTNMEQQSSMISLFI